MTGTHDAKRLFVRLKPSGGNVVIGMEATGYLLVLVVAAFFLYSWYTQVPVLAGTQGTASPATLVKIVNAEDAGKLGADIPGGKIVTAEGSISHLPASAREKARVDFFDGKMEK
jgi:hypothetical protein